MEFNGVISKKFSNNFRGKTLTSFALRGVDGFFNTGNSAIGFSEGDSITFNATQGNKPGNFQVDVASVKAAAATQVVNNAPVYVPAPRNGGAQRSGGVMTSNQFWERKEAREIHNQRIIALQSCRNSAIALLQATGPGTMTPEEFIDKWTNIFLDDNAQRYAVTEEVADAPAATGTDNWS